MRSIFILLTVVIVVFAAGCSMPSMNLVYGKTQMEVKQAMDALEKTGFEERRYQARLLKDTFLLKDNKEIYKIRCLYGILEIAVLDARDKEFKSAIDNCFFVYNQGGLRDKNSGLLNKAGRVYGNTLAKVLPVSVKDRKSREWKDLAAHFNKIKNRVPINANKWQLYIIREAGALNAVETVTDDPAIKDYQNLMKEYPGTQGAKIAKKMVEGVIKARAGLKRYLEPKHIIRSSEPLIHFYNATIEKLDGQLDKLGEKSMEYIK